MKDSIFWTNFKEHIFAAGKQFPDGKAKTLQNIKCFKYLFLFKNVFLFSSPSLKNLYVTISTIYYQYVWSYFGRVTVSDI